jgi:hypothetical protein
LLKDECKYFSMYLDNAQVNYHSIRHTLTLFELIEQQDLIRPSPNALCKGTTFLISYEMEDKSSEKVCRGQVRVHISHS